MSKARCRLGLGAILLAIACSEKSNAGRAADSALPIIGAADTGSARDCPATGQWLQCSVLKRLERAGLSVHADSLTEIRDAPLSIAGKRLPIAGGEIEIFLYADSGSRVRDAAKLDPRQFIPPSREPSILRQRTIVTNENLLVLMNVANETNRERIATNLLAGPPQPPRQQALGK
jgi:hypothetical protein